MKSIIIRALWGDLRGEELKKFTLLAAGFFFLIGSFWPLKTLKDSVFINIVGSSYQPKAKIISLLFFFPLVMGYSWLVDRFSKEKMIYLFVAIFGTAGIAFAYALSLPEIGLSNTIAHPSRILGWAFYAFIESYVSLMVALFWSFINDITTPESAKKGYGMIIFGTQLGGLLTISGANLLSRDVTLYAERAPLVALLSFLLFFVFGGVVYLLTRIVRKQELRGYAEHKQQLHEHQLQEEGSVGFFDGLVTLVKQPYVLGIFGLVFFHEVISTMAVFQMYVTVETQYIDPGMRNRFLFDLNLLIQLVACLFGLLGTSYFQRKFGITFCIVAYPLLLGASIASYLYMPSILMIGSVMIVAKALNYAFNLPAKEILYIPTSRSTKYKAKAWIDMFGARFAKGAGSWLNDLTGAFSAITGPVVLVMVMLWTTLAFSLGNKFSQITQKGDIIDG